MRALLPVLAVATALSLTACGGDSLADRDPAGARACGHLADSRDTNREPELRVLDVVTDAGHEGDAATTQSIADAVGKQLMPPGAPEVWEVDNEALAAACEAEGYEIPSAPSKG